MCSFQVEVDEDPAEAKKDEQDEKTEVFFWLLAWTEYLLFSLLMSVIV